MILLLAVLSWLPAVGTGPSAEFLLRADAPTVVIIIGDQLNGYGTCYMAVETGAAVVWVHHDASKEWRTSGERCSATALKESAGIRLNVAFIGKWKGEQTVYLMERPGPGWFRSGLWTVTEDTIPWLPPSFEPAAPEPAPAPVMRMVTERMLLDGVAVDLETVDLEVKNNPAPGQAALSFYIGRPFWTWMIQPITPFGRKLRMVLPKGRLTAFGDQVLVVYWTFDDP